MALNDVATESAVGPHRPLEIHSRTGAQILEACAVQCLAGQICGRSWPGAERADRETDAVYSNALPCADPIQNASGPDTDASETRRYLRRRRSRQLLQ